LEDEESCWRISLKDPSEIGAWFGSLVADLLETDGGKINVSMAQVECSVQRQFGYLGVGWLD
jgi:hypothetical protein